MKTTELIFVLDRSGSMAGLESDTIGGYNAFIEKQKQKEENVLVTTILFDDRYEVLWDSKPVHEVKLTSDEYNVRGTTALLDALGKSILATQEKLAKFKEKNQTRKVIFIITTDGLENASQIFTYHNVKNLLESQKEKEGWEFIFLGANIDVLGETSKLGIDKEDSISYKATSDGIKTMYETIYTKVNKKLKDA